MIEIRPLQKTDDMLAVSNIYEQSWKCAYRGIIPDEYFDSILTGQLLGTSSYCKSRIEGMDDWGEIVSIYLLPEAMHKGYGKKLMQAVISELKTMGYQKVYLWVLEKNISARGFYERFGFMLSGRITTDTFAGKELKEVQYILEF